jgi:hypothetical protein
VSRLLGGPRDPWPSRVYHSRCYAVYVWQSSLEVTVKFKLCHFVLDSLVFKCCTITIVVCVSADNSTTTMSFITQPTLPTTRPAYRRPAHPPRTLASHPRRPSVSLAAAASHPKPKPTVAAVPTGKPLRTSKTTEKLVLLPSAPQTKPLVPPLGIAYPGAPEDDVLLGYETDAGPVREYKSAAERMSKEQREKAGYKRITAYCVAEGIKMKLLAGFLKREHNVQPRVFDEAMYVVSVPSMCIFQGCLASLDPAPYASYRAANC